jgi:hypothetical protein
MIILSDEAASPQRVILDVGDAASGRAAAWIELRPATALEYYEARERTRPLIAGMLLGRRSEDALALILGAEFGERQGSDDVAFAAAASERLALIELATLCATAWSGVANADGSPAALDRVNIARLLRMPAYADRVSAVVNRAFYERRAEGNAFAALPSGEAAVDGNGARTATTTDMPAPSDDATAMERSAPSTRTVQ